MGSWYYILFLISFLLIWIIINVIGFINRWDPYPFILLNLALSCTAAIQEPIILMSQNRLSDRDRSTAKYDHYINTKSEKEIRELQKSLKTLSKLIKQNEIIKSKRKKK